MHIDISNDEEEELEDNNTIIRGVCEAGIKECDEEIKYFYRIDDNVETSFWQGKQEAYREVIYLLTSEI